MFFVIDIIIVKRKTERCFEIRLHTYGVRGTKDARGTKRRMGTLGKDSGGPVAVRVQLKCRASATQQQPPINKRDYCCTTSRISVQEDCSVTSQPVRRWWLQEPPPILSSRFLISLSPCVPSSILFLRFSHFVSLSFPLYSFSVSRTHTYTHKFIYVRARAMDRRSAFCLWRSQ